MGHQQNNQASPRVCFTHGLTSSSKYKMLHNLPPVPAFRDALPDDPIQEIALRVVVELPGWQFFAMGTAVLIAKHLAITAHHVLDAAIRKFGAKRNENTLEVDGALPKVISSSTWPNLSGLECCRGMGMPKRHSDFAPDS